MNPTTLLRMLREDPEAGASVTLLVIRTILSLPAEAQVGDVEFEIHTKNITIPIAASIPDVSVVRQLFLRLERGQIAWSPQGNNNGQPVTIDGRLGSRPAITIGLDQSQRRLHLSFMSMDERG